MMVKTIFSGKLSDHIFFVGMSIVATIVIYLNWYARSMEGLLPGYMHYRNIILNGFNYSSMITFPMWGYGWLMVLTTNKLCLLVMQMIFALLSLFYFIFFLGQEKIISQQLITMFKGAMLISIPWYAFHVLRWPYSIASSLLILSFVLLYRSIIDYNKRFAWLKLLASALLFGLLLHFRSDYWLIPLGLFVLIGLFFKKKRVIYQLLIWLFVIYGCLIPWALYTKKACGHYLLTSTNAGHVMFIGLGDHEHNRWGITPSDGDPLMHTLVDEHFKTYKHSTLDYEADQFLKHAFFERVKQHPWSYIKKCFYSCKASVLEGFYPGEFYEAADGKIEAFKNKRIRYLVLDIIKQPIQLLTDFSTSIRILLTAFSYGAGILLLVFSYCVLPLTVWYGVVRKRSLFFVLMLAAIAYQTLINSCFYHMSSYTSNLYIFYLLNALYGASMLPAFLYAVKSVLVRVQRVYSVG